MRAATYLAKRLRRDGLAGLRGSAYLSLCAAALVSFAVLMPSLEYQHVRGIVASRWDLWVSGPLGDSDLRALADVAGVERLVPALTFSVDSVRGPRTKAEHVAGAGHVTAIAYRLPTELDDGPYPRELLLSGSPPAAGELACDWSTARRFRLRVGDRVDVTVKSPGREATVSGRLAGIYGPTGILKDSLVLPATPELVEAVGCETGVRWSDAFIRCEDATARSAIRDAVDPERTLVVPRIDLGREARSRLMQDVGPFLRSGATWVALAGFAALALWQQSTRQSRRRGEYAVLSALGMSRASLVRLDSVEQALRLGLTSTAGIALARLLIQEVNGMYVPRETLCWTFVIVLAAVAVTLGVGAIAVARLIRAADLSDTLSRETLT